LCICRVDKRTAEAERPGNGKKMEGREEEGRGKRKRKGKKKKGMLF
jgi:hypothetical protein